MNTDALTYVVSHLSHIWGSEKLAQTILISLSCGFLAFAICSVAIPNKPEITEKENSND